MNLKILFFNFFLKRLVERGVVKEIQKFLDMLFYKFEEAFQFYFSDLFLFYELNFQNSDFSM